MEPFVRRSYLVISPLDENDVAASWTHNADAVILDLAGPVPDARKAEARASLSRAVPVAGRGAAEVFVRVNKALLYADVEAAAVPGLRGIVLGGAGCAEDVARADAILGEVEARKGIPEGHLQIVVLLETARGVWNVREIIAASARVSAVGLDEPALCRALGIAPCEEFDPFSYAKGRIVIETRAAKVQPVGVSHPYGVLPRFDDADDIHRLALRGKNLGFAATICPHPSWVEPVNRAQTPTEERLEFYQETRRLFADAIARGTAAIPYPGTGMMIDVPVDERARLTLEMWERCAARDAEKAEAVRRANQA